MNHLKIFAAYTQRFLFELYSMYLPTWQYLATESLSVTLIFGPEFYAHKPYT